MCFDQHSFTHATTEKERERERESVCVCVCVCVRERERERERARAYEQYSQSNDAGIFSQENVTPLCAVRDDYTDSPQPMDPGFAGSTGWQREEGDAGRKSALLCTQQPSPARPSPTQIASVRDAVSFSFPGTYLSQTRGGEVSLNNHSQPLIMQI